MKSPCLVVISGPSGVGKSTILRPLFDDARVVFSVSATTRAPRPGERDGVDYVFLDEKTFEERIARGEFLEHAQVHGKRYGTLRAPIEAAIRAGKFVILDIDVQGARSLRQQGVEALYVLIAPPSMEDLERRLRGRGTESEENLRLRLANAREELAARELYDHVVINQDVESARAALRSVIGLDPL